MNKQLLKAQIVAHGDTQETLADALHMAVSNLSLRINGHVDFKQSEINQIIRRYNLSDSDIRSIFFVDVVS